ncbi:MAG: tellurite resistance TerB C-terminal domain-containing protein [Janthinobacterium lividum]
MRLSFSVASTPDLAIIDVTGPAVPLRLQEPVAIPALVQPAIPPLSAPYTPPDYGYDMPKLGARYRKKLDLTAQQVEWLDKFWPPHNVFVAIEGCCVATIQLYLRALPVLEAKLLRTGDSLAQVVLQCQQEVLQLRKATPNPYGYSWSDDERYLRQQTEAMLFETLFRRCENVVRATYGNKRKLAAEFSGLDGALSLALEKQLSEPFAALLPGLVATINAPDEATERELNLQNVTRWKQQLDELAIYLSATTTQAFVDGVNQLGQRNARNPAVENIFFEASKLMAPYDREQALRFYVQYVHHDLHSATVNNKPLGKTIQKSLFPQPEHLQRFEALVSQLTRDKNLALALDQVPAVYARQRRKIELDLGAIREVQHQHAGTVELLNEYLQDEPEIALTAASGGPTGPLATELVLGEEIQLAMPTLAPAASMVNGALAATWGLNATQEALLGCFAAQGLVLPQATVEAFAKQHGALRNQLIDGINERCYERLDDVLIEEDGDTYTIYEPYYQQLAAPC